MKLSEFENLNKFLSVLFAFFKENGIDSSMKPVEDYNLLLAKIINSEFNHISYNPGIYSADFILNTRIEVGEVYYFIFGSTEAGGSLLIDLGERGLSSFFNFTWDNEKHPPFLMDFKKDDKIIINSEAIGLEAEYLEEKDVLTFDEFTRYLDMNSGQGRLNVVVVE